MNTRTRTTGILSAEEYERIRSRQALEHHSSDEPMPAVVPYGYLRCTCEKHPRLVYINDQMLEALGAGQANQSWQDALKDDIFLIIPSEERDKFQHYLDEAIATGRPVNIEHKLLGKGGSRISLMGWVAVQENDQGAKEFAFLYMRPEYKHTEKLSVLEDRYIRALKSAYNIIFEINIAASTIECIHGRETSDLGSIADLQMTLDSAKSFWLNNYIHPEDREMMTTYLNRITIAPLDWDGRQILQAEFRVNWLNGSVYHLVSIAVKMSPSKVLLCCWDNTELEFGGVRTRESYSFEKMRDWLDVFSTSDPNRLGMIIFEQTEKSRPLIYASPPIRHYLTNGQDAMPQTLELSKEMSQEDIQQLLEKKRLSLTLAGENGERNITLTAKRYPMKGRILYIIWVREKQQPKEEPASADKRIFARTFGHFDLFVDGTPMTFSNAKEKELLALLIDRNGGTLSTSEAISYLWEDEAPDERVFTRYRKLVMGLKRTLESYGIGHILISQKGVRSVDVHAFECDYYEYLAGNPKYLKTFHNAYMTDYSWSEETLARLWIDTDSHMSEND
jgi:hypothetical protein